MSLHTWSRQSALRMRVTPNSIRMNGSRDGKQTTLTAITHIASLWGKGANNDDASSTKVIGDGSVAELSQPGDYKGWNATFTTGEHNSHNLVGKERRMTMPVIKVDRSPMR